MILNVGCGGRQQDKASMMGDVRLDLERLPPVTMIANAHNLPFKERVFDKILSFEVLEHLESPIKALREFKRVLKEEGSVIIIVPNMWYWRLLVKCWLGLLFKRYEQYRQLEPASLEIDHKQGWDIYEFQRLLHQVGLKSDYYDWLNWYGSQKGRRRELDFIEPFIPKHIRHTHILFRLSKRKFN